MSVACFIATASSSVSGPRRTKYDDPSAAGPATRRTCLSAASDVILAGRQPTCKHCRVQSTNHSDECTITNRTRKLTTSRSHVMPPPLHLSDCTPCKCFPYWRCHGKQFTLLERAVNERTNEDVYRGCMSADETHKRYSIIVLRMKIKLL